MQASVRSYNIHTTSKENLRLAGAFTLRERGTSDFAGLGEIGLLLNWASRLAEGEESEERLCCIRTLLGESNVCVARCVSYIHHIKRNPVV